MELKKRKKITQKGAITQLFEKKKKKLHNLLTATDNLNPKLWIRTYKGQAKIRDLLKKKKGKNSPKIRQKGHAVTTQLV